MSVILSDNLTIGREALDCPWWCTSNHDGLLTADEEQRYRIRAHAGHEHDLRDIRDELGDNQTAATALVQVDNLANGERGPVGVAAICEGVMTPEQAMQFASMILAAATRARTANDNGPAGLVPDSDWLRGNAA